MDNRCLFPGCLLSFTGWYLFLCQYNATLLWQLYSILRNYSNIFCNVIHFTPIFFGKSRYFLPHFRSFFCLQLNKSPIVPQEWYQICRTFWVVWTFYWFIHSWKGDDFPFSLGPLHFLALMFYDFHHRDILFLWFDLFLDILFILTSILNGFASLSSISDNSVLLFT